MNLKKMTEAEWQESEARLGSQWRNGELAHLQLEHEHPALYLDVKAFAERLHVSKLEYSRLAYYCLDRGVAETEIVPLFWGAAEQAGAQYRFAIMEMADRWKDGAIVSHLLKAKPYPS
ncbi:hypothetical protein [Chromobacterium haemolyticum]|uniref:hypothetical protein n=1 Tax=Chromobacterium haemolyticum TaxID=394935 RepID=UPI0009D92369|nr:hypothetical protein [Chromobacterium haemolyticum]OQS32990.1 hypothetical protein B0T39_21650 [Chromobacterium haemolyticum]